MKKILRHGQKAALYFMQLSLVFAIILEAINARWTLLFATTIILLLQLTPYFFEKKYRIDLPLSFELMIVFLIYGSLYLGTIQAYYTSYWWWDSLLHFGSGILLGIAGFLFMYTLYIQGRITAEPGLIAIFSFCFAVATGAIWEIYEFGQDAIFGTNMQESGLPDTMGDLIVDSIGAAIVATLGYFQIKKGNMPFFTGLIKEFKQKNPHMVAKRRNIKERIKQKIQEQKEKRKKKKEQKKGKKK